MWREEAETEPEKGNCDLYKLDSKVIQYRALG